MLNQIKEGLNEIGKVLKRTLLPCLPLILSSQISSSHAQVAGIIKDESPKTVQSDPHRITIRKFGANPTDYISETGVSIINFGDDERCGGCKEIKVFEPSLGNMPRVQYTHVNVPYTNERKYGHGWQDFKDIVVAKGIGTHLPVILYCIDGECCELELSSNKHRPNLFQKILKLNTWEIPMSVKGVENAKFSSEDLIDSMEAGEQIGRFITGLRAILRPPSSRYEGDKGNIIEGDPNAVSRFSPENETLALHRLAEASCAYYGGDKPLYINFKNP